MSSYKKITDFINAEKKESPVYNKKGDVQKYQKDWIISDFVTGNLFCLTIASVDGENWYILEYVNFFGLPNKKMKEMIDMGYYTMLEAAKTFRDYIYVIGEHDYNRDDFNKEEYWKELLPKSMKKSQIKQSFKRDELKIDRKEFEAEVAKLFPKSDIIYKV